MLRRTRHPLVEDLAWQFSPAPHLGFLGRQDNRNRVEDPIIFILLFFGAAPSSTYARLEGLVSQLSVTTLLWGF